MHGKCINNQLGPEGTRPLL